ncbi:MAG: hypothetical protein AAF587_30920 [Bacteroidota bacterium]
MDIREISLPFDAAQISAIQALNIPRLTFLIIRQDGEILLFDPQTSVLSSHISQLDQGIDVKQVGIYSYRDYCCIVDNRGTRGVVLSLTDPTFQKHLIRGDYQVEHCSFPIGFYSRGDQTFLIHGTDWNRLDITCLETDELLTERIVDYESETNYVDYFHSLLSVSPDENSFITNGWVWNPIDVIKLYKIDTFLVSYESSDYQSIFPEGRNSGYLWDRPACWMDSETVVIGYNKQEEFNEQQFASELQFMKIGSEEIVKKIPFDGFAVNDEGEISGSLHHDTLGKQLLVFHPDKGLLVTDYVGKVLYQDVTFQADRYSEQHRMFYSVRDSKLLLNHLFTPQ